MTKFSLEELQNLIQQGETTTVELKVAPPRPAELAERLCGMANAQGGIIIVGVDVGTTSLALLMPARPWMSCFGLRGSYNQHSCWIHPSRKSIRWEGSGLSLQVFPRMAGHCINRVVCVGYAGEPILCR